MKNNIYNHSFARRLTRWLMLVLFVMMAGLAYLIYEVVKMSMVEVVAVNFHDNMELSEKNICDALSDVSVAVENNIFYIERHIGQPAELQATMERMVAQNPRMRSCGISFIENYFPQKGRSFCPYAWQKDSLQVEGQPIQGSDASYLESDWFKEAVAADSAYWSKPFFDSRDNKTPLVAYLYPIHDQKGRVVAILGADLSLDFMTNLLMEQSTIFQKGSMVLYDADLFKSYVLTNDGTYITHPDQRRILKGNFFVHIKDADKSGVAQKTISLMQEGKKSFDETNEMVRVNCTKSYLFYSPIGSTDWILVYSVGSFAIDIIGIVSGFVMLIIISFVLLVTFFVCRLTIQRAAKPLRQLASSADQMADGQFRATLPSINSHDEIHLLRDSFANMQQSLSSYVEELKKTTAAKASMESELKIAHDIQMSMLPKTYPAFPDRHDVDIYGLVLPAKAVGGDLYDFFIHDEKLFFCIGDVSGKGVPASLVMAVTRSLFRNISAYTQQPDQIAVALNDALSSNNDMGMFVTLFLGVLDLASGHLSYSNAGHNPPLLLAGDDVSVISCDANLPAGVMSGHQFTEQHLQLKSGDSVFLYTDGLNEAENASQQQFGMERVMQLAKVTVNQPLPLIEAMMSSVQLFVGDAEQSDDLTMLAIQYINPSTHNKNDSHNNGTRH
ncbi:MAG: SpoIIE family protein phosphatase [Prevotella sp.]|nr:SpoIIE family protein phosphatase [Prevotella sp.]